MEPQPNRERNGEEEVNPDLETIEPLVAPFQNQNREPEMGKAKRNRLFTPEYSPYSSFCQNATTTAHACLFLYVTLVAYLCFSGGDFALFTWHPLLLSIGWMFLMTEAILALSKDSFLTGTLPKAVKVRLHWILQSLALALIGPGFLVVYINKNLLNKEHFMSWHGLLGLIATIVALATCLGGLLTLHRTNVKVRRLVSPKIIKVAHIFGGLVTYGCGGFALVLSTYTKWFERQTGDNNLVFVAAFGAIVIAVVWTLIRPCMDFYKQIKYCVTH